MAGRESDLNEDGEVEDTESEGEEVTKRRSGRGPLREGPCEHGVKYRSKCKVCSACPHGKQRSYCRVRWVSNLCARTSALSVQGVRWGLNQEHGVSALSARSAVGLDLRARSYTLSVQGVVGAQSASTVVAIGARSGGSAFLEHGRQRRYCKECGGHQSTSTAVYALRARSAVEAQSVSTVAGALSARSAVGLRSASTAACAIGARRAAKRSLSVTSR